MKILKQRLDIAQKIAEELMGTIDEKSQVELNRWIREDKKHETEYNKIRELLSGADAWEDQNKGQQLVDAQWAILSSRLFVKKVRFMNWAKYAATILLPLCVGLFLFLNERNKEERALASVIVPGELSARLELADGKTIVLDDKTNFHIKEAGLVEISTDNKMVEYTGQDTLGQEIIEEKYNTLTVPKGGEFVLALADGTRVWLNSDSKLRYPVYFVGKERKVEMSGEVYFEVAENKKKPFVVTVNGMDVRVLGTKFNVSAYHSEAVTTLVEGKVQLNKGDVSVVLLPNQQAICLENQFDIKRVNARDYVLWKDGIFYFDDVELETMLDRMARWYNVDVIYMEEALKTKKFSVEIKRYENIDKILRKIEQTQSVRFNIKDRIISVCKYK